MAAPRVATVSLCLAAAGIWIASLSPVLGCGAVAFAEAAATSTPVRITGGGTFQMRGADWLPGFDGHILARASVHVIVDANGTAAGKLEAAQILSPRDEQQASWMISVDVRCVKLEGNVAWLVGQVVRGQPSDQVGDFVVLQVTDNGDSNDQLLMRRSYGQLGEWCANPPLLSDPLTFRGNIRIQTDR